MFKQAGNVVDWRSRSLECGEVAVRYRFTFVRWTHELVSRGRIALELPDKVMNHGKKSKPTSFCGQSWIAVVWSSAFRRAFLRLKTRLKAELQTTAIHASHVLP